jgi:glycosyltransferase involved in cell wall biosynthesis
MSQLPKPTVLVLVGHYLPGFKAGGIPRSVENLVNHLHDEFRFLIVTRDRDFGDTSPYPDVPPGAWHSVGNAAVYYLTLQKQTLGALSRLIGDTDHDLIYLNSCFDPLTVKVLLNARRGSVGGRPIVLAPRGEFSWASFKIKYFKKLLFVGLARLIGLHRSVVWHAASEIEAHEIIGVMKVRRAAIQVAIDLPTVASDGVIVDVRSNDDGMRDRLHIVFLSRISPEKNLDLALQILGRVRARVVFDIVGPLENAVYWAKCEQLLKELPSNVEVRVRGAVLPHQVLPMLEKYDLLLFPSGGESYGHVIAEALTVGTSVLISTETPWRDLETKGLGWDLPLADPDAFVRAIEQYSALSHEERLGRRRRVKERALRMLADPSLQAPSRQIFRTAIAKQRSVDRHKPV